MPDSTDSVEQPTPRRKPKPAIEEIGGRKLKPATLMMGHGFDPVSVRRFIEAADLPDLDFCL